MTFSDRTYLCWRTSQNGIARAIDPSTLISTAYQLDKFVKHTVVDPIFRIASVFKDPRVKIYESWVVNSVASGCVAFDANGAHSYIFVAGKEVGLTYKRGSFHTIGDSVKVVLPTDPEKVHAYPMSSHIIAAKKCATCGDPVAA